MKLYDNSDIGLGLAYRSRLKFGAEMVVPAAIMGGASLVSSIFGASSASRNNSASLAYSSQENANQRAWEEQMYQRQHYDMVKDTIDTEMRSNVEYNRRQEMAMRQMQDMTEWIQKNYASPAAQAKAMRAAGFNPAMMLGSGGQGFATAVQNAPQVSAPTPQYSPVGGMTSPLMSPPSLQNEGQIFSQGLESLSRSVSNVVQADKTSQESRRLRDTHDIYVETMLTDKLSKQTAQEQMALQLSLDKMNLPKRQKLELDKLFKDIQLAEIQSDYTSAQSAFTKLQSRISEILEKKENIHLQFWRKGLELNQQHTIADIALKENQAKAAKAAASQSYASAENLHAQTKTENDIRQWKVDLERLNSLIAKSENTIKQASVQAEIEMLANRAVASGLANKETQERIQVLIKEKNWYELNKLLNGLGAGAVVGALVK